MINLQLAFRPYREIRKIAKETLLIFGLQETLPIPIEELLDVTLGINLIPHPNLYRTREISAYLSNDLKRIFIDEYQYLNLEKKLRFTLAHEFAHLTLHQVVYDKHKPPGKSEWLDFVVDLAEVDRSILEQEADDFAGLFLVPDEPLLRLYSAFIEDNQAILLKKYKLFSGKYPKDMLNRIFIRHIADELSDQFNVAPDVIVIRAIKSGQIHPIEAIVSKR